MARWYDKDEELVQSIEKIRDSDEKIRDGWVKDILDIINRNQPEKMNTETLLEFPLTMFRRRWYDSDPYLWIMMNSLENASGKTMAEVKDYLAGI